MLYTYMLQEAIEESEELQYYYFWGLSTYSSKLGRPTKLWDSDTRQTFAITINFCKAIASHVSSQAVSNFGEFVELQICDHDQS